MLLYRSGPLAYGPGMELREWLAREAERDLADGLQPTVSDPTALGLLALGISEAQRLTQPPVVAQDA